MKVFEDYAEEIWRFFRDVKGLPLDPRPKVTADLEPRGPYDPFAPTGHYDFMDDEITVYAAGRQLKDVLRTYAHELVHASQYRRDPDGYAAFDRSGTIASNRELREYEREAYELGNLYFREWTETYTE